MRDLKELARLAGMVDDFAELRAMAQEVMRECEPNEDYSYYLIALGQLRRWISDAALSKQWDKALAFAEICEVVSRKLHTAIERQCLPH